MPWHLMEHLGISVRTIDISELALKAFQEMGHAPFGIDCTGLDCRIVSRRPGSRAREARCDLTFENVQARLRTFLLMSRGFVIGTGDLSELALGWSTYNGDHMSMYNPNCSIPKTLVKFLVRYVALNQFPEGAGAADACYRSWRRRSRRSYCRHRAAGEIEQSTEATLGPFELHDFILYHAVRCGYLAGQDLVPEPVRHIHPALSARSDRADDERLSTTGSSTINTSGRAFPTAPRSAPSASRPAATGECRPTPMVGRMARVGVALSWT